MRLLLATLLLSLAACTSEVSEPESGTLPNDYSYDLSISCFCSCEYIGPHHIEIRDGRIAKYEHTNSDCSIMEDLPKEQFLIDALQKRAKELSEYDDADISSESYHPVYKFLTEFSIDPIPNVADDTWAFQITNFKKL